MSDVTVQLAEPDAAGMFGARTVSEFAAWALAFRCIDCGVLGSAERQCAACGNVLCANCGVRCCLDQENRWSRDMQAWGSGPPTGNVCSLALCGDCHDDNSLLEHPSREDVLDADAPGLFAPVCTACPKERLLCIAHVDLCILECHTYTHDNGGECQTRRCIDGNDYRHRGPDYRDYVNKCAQCDFKVCGKPSCNSERTIVVRDGCTKT
jgi:hypothetical protein